MRSGLLPWCPTQWLPPWPPVLADLISASLIICGITSFIQVKSIPLPFNRQWGAGVLSVMGVSFTTVSIATTVVGTMMVRAGVYLTAGPDCSAVLPARAARKSFWDSVHQDSTPHLNMAAVPKDLLVILP